MKILVTSVVLLGMAQTTRSTQCFDRALLDKPKESAKIAFLRSTSAKGTITGPLEVGRGQVNGIDLSRFNLQKLQEMFGGRNIKFSILGDEGPERPHFLVRDEKLDKAVLDVVGDFAWCEPGKITNEDTLKLYEITLYGPQVKTIHGIHKGDTYGKLRKQFPQAKLLLESFLDGNESSELPYVQVDGLVYSFSPEDRIYHQLLEFFHAQMPFPPELDKLLEKSKLNLIFYRPSRDK